MTRLNKYMVLFLLLMIFSINNVFSQENTPLSLEECIKIALENNSTLRNAAYREQIAATTVTSARSAFLPTVSTSFSSGKMIQGARRDVYDIPTGEIDPVTGSAIYTQQEIMQDKTERNSHSARISLSQQIYDFGRSTNNYKAAKSSQKSYEYLKLSTKQQVILSVKEAYFQLLKDMRLQSVYEQALKQAQGELDRVQTEMEIGLASQADVFQQKVSMGTYQKQMITQQNVVEISKADLNNALGRNPETPVLIREDDGQPVFSEITFQEAAQIALENNQQIKSYEMEVKTALFNIRAAKAQYLPSIGASASYSRSNEDMGRVYSDQLDQDYTVSIGASLDLNIFNGFADKANIQQKTLSYKIAQENLTDKKRTVIASVKQYYLELEAYKDIIKINQENIESAQENLRLQQEKRRVGSGTELEVTNAQVQLITAQKDLVNVEFDAKIAKSYLDVAMGIIQ